MNLMRGNGGTAIIGPREVLTFSDWGEPMLCVYTPGKGVRIKWAVTLADRTGAPGPRPWVVRRLPDGSVAVVIRFGAKQRAFDLTTGHLLWTRPQAVGLGRVLQPLVARLGH